MAGARKNQAPEQPAGSPPNGEPAFLVVGKLRHPHGLRGEILMEVITDFPERLQPGFEVFIGEEHRPERIRSRRAHGQGLLVAFDGYTTPETVGELRNALVYVPTASRPALPPGEYYHHQLLGLHVIEENGNELGRLAEILLPATDEVILEIDLENSLLRVHLLPGLVCSPANRHARRSQALLDGF